MLNIKNPLEVFPIDNHESVHARLFHCNTFTLKWIMLSRNGKNGFPDIDGEFQALRHTIQAETRSFKPDRISWHAI